MKLGLFGKELAAIDGSKFKAVNSKERNFNEAKLNDRIKRLNARINEYMQQLNETDKTEDKQDNDKTTNIKQVITKLQERKSTYQSYLEELTVSGENQKSLTDPDSKLMLGHGKHDVCYNEQTWVDSGHKLIAEFKVTNQGNDMNQLADMAISTAEALENPDITVVADTGFNNAHEIASCIARGITPQVAGSDGELCIPCDTQEAEDITSHENCRGVYVRERNIVICPMGKVMYPGCYKNREKSARYYNGRACSECTCRCTETKYRAFDIRMKKSEFSKEYNADNLHVKKIKIKTDGEIIKKRKELSEHPFGSIKRSMGVEHVLTKGIESVTGEFSLVFLAYNLKRVLNIIGAKKMMKALT